MKIDYDIPIEPGQKFIVDRFRREDAKGIAHLFFNEYGPGYPFEVYYIPERIVEENANGNIYSVVARTHRGDIIGHGALYRSSPHHQDLYEIGQYIIHRDYRTSFAAYKINQYIAEELTPSVRPDGVFGEAVCNHVITQKSSYLIGMKDTALEIDLMPAEAYEKAKSATGRVSCLILYLPVGDGRREIFIPEVYKWEVENIMTGADLSRELISATAEIPADRKSDVSVRFFSHAGVGRFNVVAAGTDFPAIIDRLEEEGRQNGIAVYQYFLSMGIPWIGQVTEILRGRGYFFGGCVPRWFDTDGLLMQKLFTKPNFMGINLHAKKAKELLSVVRADWERSQSV
ncbi:MAG: hypothetical protein PHN75_05940 [Syntrophales bacterium]|nr:hypothetical protein [Syntrophales bacterium]